MKLPLHQVRFARQLRNLYHRSLEEEVSRRPISLPHMVTVGARRFALLALEIRLGDPHGK